MSTYKLISVLLDYPSEELLGNLGEIQRRAATESGLSFENLERLTHFLAYLGSVDLLDLQAEYVQTFDMTPEHSLHLTHHLCGDDRNRGPALIELTELYRTRGFEIPDNELPDYLPLVLEFLHTLPAEEAQGFLAEAGRVVAIIAANLERSASPWHAGLRILADMSGYKDDPKACGEDMRPTKDVCQSACGAMID
ncbi:Respiratory nitrate reductase delta chain [Rhodospirillaceae bacterium LM-1]|nr:Respiratory nitrate reductase delta chain [Rhodospirillaceae bacterium LM-1]